MIKSKTFKTLEFRNLNLFRISNFEFRIFLLFVLPFLLVSPAYAAEFKLESDATIFGVGDEFLVQVRIDTAGEVINAIEGEVVFPEELVELKRIQEKGSIVSLWIKEPPLFSGLTPGGYVGQGVLFSLVFEAKAEGSGTIGLAKGRALLHDGQGTPAPLEVSHFGFLIPKEPPNGGPTGYVSKRVVNLDDTEPPEPFELRIGQAPDVFGGQPFLVFTTQDKNSGVEYYAISFVRNGRESAWVKAESPFLLGDIRAVGEIRVRAVDRAGNERVATLSVGSSSSLKFLLYGNLGILIGIGGVFALLRVRKHGQSKK